MRRTFQAATVLAVSAVLGAPASANALTIDDGHVDYGARLVGGVFQSQIKDGTASGAPVWREPSGVVFHVRPTAKLTLPANGKFNFLGPAGSDVWLIPQVQQQGIIWAGWNTEELAGQVAGPVTWRLTGVEGPGNFALFQNDAFGNPDVLFNAGDGLPDARNIALGTHAHGNWGFTREGVYRLTFEMSAPAAGGGTVSDTETLAVAVGNIDPAAVPPGPTPAGGEPPAVPLRSKAAPRVSLRTGTARVAGRSLRVRVRLNRRSRVAIAVRRGRRLSAHAKTRTVPAGSSTLKVKLSRKLGPGRYRLHVKASAGGRSVLRKVTLRVRKPRARRSQSAAAAAAPLAERAQSKTVLGNGHVDYGMRLVRGRLRAQVKDTTKGAHRLVWREPSSVVWQINSRARYKLPAGAPRSLGKRGDTVFMVPQVQKQGVLWAGWNTEELSARRVSGRVTWRLTKLTGPGHLVLFSTGSFGAAKTIFNSADGLPDGYRIPLGTHAHGNWAFTKEGIYKLTFQVRAKVRSKGTQTDTDTITVAVGSADPQGAAAGDSRGAGESAGTASTGGEALDDDLSSASAQGASDEADGYLPTTGYVLWPQALAALAMGVSGLGLRGRLIRSAP